MILNSWSRIVAGLSGITIRTRNLGAPSATPNSKIMTGLRGWPKPVAGWYKIEEGHRWAHNKYWPKSTPPTPAKIIHWPSPDIDVRP